MTMRERIRATRPLLLGVALSAILAAPAPAAAPADAPVVSMASAVYMPAPALSTELASASDLVDASALLAAAQRRDLGSLSAAESLRLAAPDKASSSGIGTLRRRVGVVREVSPAAGFAAALPALARGERRALGDGLLSRAADGRLAWTAAVTSRGSQALRLYLTGAGLPEGSRAYVYTGRGEVRGPYTLPESGGLWTNTVEGDQAFVELQLPSTGAAWAGARFAVERVGHLSPSGSSAVPERGEAPAYVNTCFLDEICVDASEFPAIDQATRAVAQLNFTSGSDMFVCTGTLINANPAPALPYLLTAHHCISTPDEAASLEAVYNDRAASCGGAPPDRAQLPRTLGATLLATGTVSDFTLLRLAQAPPTGAVLLGWSTQNVATDSTVTLFRLSHPGDGNTIAPQIYAREAVLTDPASCGGVDYPDFIYSRVDKGGEGPGSSGSSFLLSDGRIVGQLYGTCGNATTPCSLVQHVNGAFRTTYPHVAAFLNPGGSDGCTTTETTLCLSNNRYRVTANWQSATDSGQAHVQPLTADTGYLWFFSASNVELIVKVLNACTFAHKFWVFAGGLTNVQVTLTVTDTITGNVKTYLNPQSTAFRPIQDITTFATCP
jgi:hypothetical protein